MVDVLNDRQRVRPQPTARARRRRIALILILIVDVGYIAWGTGAAMSPDHLLGPGGKGILPPSSGERSPSQLHSMQRDDQFGLWGDCSHRQDAEVNLQLAHAKVARAQRDYRAARVNLS